MVYNMICKLVRVLLTAAADLCVCYTRPPPPRRCDAAARGPGKLEERVARTCRCRRQSRLICGPGSGPCLVRFVCESGRFRVHRVRVRVGGWFAAGSIGCGSGRIMVWFGLGLGLARVRPVSWCVVEVCSGCVQDVFLMFSWCFRGVFLNVFLMFS